MIKADGLAAGKGVTIAATIAEAEAAIDEALVGGRFGAAGHEIVIEEFMVGEEASYFALARRARPSSRWGQPRTIRRLATAIPAPIPAAWAPIARRRSSRRRWSSAYWMRSSSPLARAMVAEGRPYRGVLFAGLMIVPARPTDPKPRLIEINVRFGDPECQVLMARLETDPVLL